MPEAYSPSSPEPARPRVEGSGLEGTDEVWGAHPLADSAGLKPCCKNCGNEGRMSHLWGGAGAGDRWPVAHFLNGLDP